MDLISALPTRQQLNKKSSILPVQNPERRRSSLNTIRRSIGIVEPENLYQSKSFSSNITNSIGMVVAFIPEGLPAAVTLVLTIVAKRMYKQKVLVKSLATVETFNFVSIIATDKTGTLTMNQMTITAILWGNQGEYMVSIYNIDDNTVVNDKRIIDREQPSFNGLRGIPHSTSK
ncbi:unnamed protein product [Adineta steineri]|uniref:Uncharacterized protein n=1 Tax=Adineta steineri TaxID=433720 RepID=A0A814P3W9_9BILA|nr:unnamed protein product [Adineta steineri]CAF3504751.1 unnamed protein product [Adineta steineri]